MPFLFLWDEHDMNMTMTVKLNSSSTRTVDGFDRFNDILPRVYLQFTDR